MLSLLHIENLAVIEFADIEFVPGLNVLTGETGAGKSILIDAIGALLGARTSKDLVRSGAQNAAISAVFSLTDSSLNKWFADNDLDIPEDGDLIISRKITAEGKSSCRINGSPVSIAQLRDLGLRLIDIHGQNDGQKLLSENNHRRYLDSFAGIDWDTIEFRELYNMFKDSIIKAETLRKNEADKESRAAELSRLVSELSSAKLKPGETDALLERRAILKNAGKLTDYINNAYYAMYGDEDSDGALPLIIDAANSVEIAARSSSSISALAESFNELRYMAEDITERLSDIKDSLTFSPEELDALESRLALLQRLERRYGNYDDMTLLLDSSKKELEDMEYLSERLSVLDTQVNKYRAEVEKAARSLTELRRKMSLILESRIADELSQLSMPAARFKVEFTKVKNPEGFSDYGCENIRFLMSANAGEPAGRISKIASGGELSRIMLAMKTILSASDDVQVLIFDEIDTGVSGVAAQRVGEKLYDLSVGKQVICVTHLPQIAVMADRQFAIEKVQDNGRTFTNVNALDTEGRKRELARLTGGETITLSTLKSAADLLAAAVSYKERKLPL